MAAFFGFFHTFLLNFLNFLDIAGSSLVLRASFPAACGGGFLGFPRGWAVGAAWGFAA
jgi:hypothetical protein